MRINIAGVHATQKAPSDIMDLWTRMLSEEYLVEPHKAMRWLYNDFDFVAEFLLPAAESQVLKDLDG